MKKIKVKVLANAYSLTGDRGKISLRWTSDANLPHTNRADLVDRIEKLVANEIENHCLTRAES